MTKTMDMDPATSFGGLQEEQWDRLAGDHFYSTSAWLRFCTAETGTPGDAIVAQGENSTWAVPIRELAGLPEWSRYRWNDHLTEAGLPELSPTGLLVGAPEGFQTHLLSDGRRSPATLAQLVGRLREVCGGTSERPWSCVAMYVTTDDVRALHSAGVTAEPVLLDADAWIPVPEDGWDAWLAGFPPKRRRNIRSEERIFREAGCRIVHMALAECWHQLGVPAASTLHKYGHHTTPEIELVSLRRVVEVLGDRARVAVCYRDDEDEDPLGFCIYYQAGDHVLIRWSGFDNDRLVGVEEYFNVLFYTQVKRAPASGVRWIHAGATTQPAKALRGAELRPLWLIDISEDSPLAKNRQDVRRYNRRMMQRFLDDPRTAGALNSREEWAAFC